MKSSSSPPPPSWSFNSPSRVPKPKSSEGEPILSRCARGPILVVEVIDEIWSRSHKPPPPDPDLLAVDLTSDAPTLSKPQSSPGLLAKPVLATRGFGLSCDEATWVVAVDGLRPKSPKPQSSSSSAKPEAVDTGFDFAAFVFADFGVNPNPASPRLVLPPTPRESNPAQADFSFSFCF